MFPVQVGARRGTPSCWSGCTPPWLSACLRQYVPVQIIVGLREEGVDKEDLANEILDVALVAYGSCATVSHSLTSSTFQPNFRNGANGGGFDFVDLKCAENNCACCTHIVLFWDQIKQQNLQNTPSPQPSPLTRPFKGVVESVAWVRNCHTKP